MAEETKIISCAQITLTDLTDTATYIYYATDANGSSPSLGPSATSKYIGIYNDESLDNQPAPGTAAYDNIKDKIKWSEYVGSDGADGALGYSLVTSVSRPSFSEAQWTTYGTIGHEETWSNTSDIRNGCRVNDLFTVVGTATDTKNSHTLTYQSTNDSGNLRGKCLSHAIAERGGTGATGPAGRSIVSIVNYYKVHSSNIDPPDPPFSTDWQQTTPTDRYLWNYETITYSDGTTEDLDMRVISTHGETGAAGADGRGIKSIADTYARTTEYDPPSSTATNTWLQTAPELTGDYKYLWCKEVITYTSGNPLTETTIRLLAQRGEQGAQGENGKDLIREGTWVEEIARYYVATIALGVNEFPKYSTDNGTDFSAWKERNASNLGWTGDPSSNQAKILFEVLGTKTTNYSNGKENSSTIAWGTAKPIDVKANGANKNPQGYLNYLETSNGGKKCGVYQDGEEGALYLDATYIKTGALDVIDSGKSIFKAGYDNNGNATVKLCDWVVDECGIHHQGCAVGMATVNFNTDNTPSWLIKNSLKGDGSKRTMVFYAFGQDQGCCDYMEQTLDFYPNFGVFDDGSMIANYGKIAGWTITPQGLYSNPESSSVSIGFQPNPISSSYGETRKKIMYIKKSGLTDQKTYTWNGVDTIAWAHAEYQSSGTKYQKNYYGYIGPYDGEEISLSRLTSGAIWKSTSTQANYVNISSECDIVNLSGSYPGLVVLTKKGDGTPLVVFAPPNVAGKAITLGGLSNKIRFPSSGIWCLSKKYATEEEYFVKGVRSQKYNIDPAYYLDLSTDGTFSFLEGSIGGWQLTKNKLQSPDQENKQISQGEFGVASWAASTQNNQTYFSNAPKEGASKTSWQAGAFIEIKDASIDSITFNHNLPISTFNADGGTTSRSNAVRLYLVEEMSAINDGYKQFRLIQQLDDDQYYAGQTYTYTFDNKTKELLDPSLNLFIFIKSIGNYAEEIAAGTGYYKGKNLSETFYFNLQGTSAYALLIGADFLLETHKGASPLMLTSNILNPTTAAFNLASNGYLEAKAAKITGEFIAKVTKASNTQYTHCVAGNGAGIIWTSFSGVNKIDGAEGIQMLVEDNSDHFSFIIRKVFYDAASQDWYITGEPEIKLCSIAHT